MRFVIDSSVALSWCFPDESTPLTRQFFELARRSELMVPPIWHFEMANVLGVHLRRGRITAEWLDQILFTLTLFDIRVEGRKHVEIAAHLFDMRAHQLTSYDASYLVLAQQLKLPIATFDKEIMTAARRAGVLLVGPLEQPV